MPKNAFDRYLDEQMKSPSFAKSYAEARVEIDGIDQLVRTLDAQRGRMGLTKAQLARRAGMEPAALRRLFTSDDPNPTFATIATLLTTLDLGLVVVAKSAASKKSAVKPGGGSRVRAGSKRVKRSTRPLHA